MADFETEQARKIGQVKMESSQVKSFCSKKKIEKKREFKNIFSSTKQTRVNMMFSPHFFGNYDKHYFLRNKNSLRKGTCALKLFCSRKLRKRFTRLNIFIQALRVGSKYNEMLTWGLCYKTLLHP